MRTIATQERQTNLCKPRGLARTTKSPIHRTSVLEFLPGEKDKSKSTDTVNKLYHVRLTLIESKRQKLDTKNPIIRFNEVTIKTTYSMSSNQLTFYFKLM